MIYLRLFFEFFCTGLFSVGGGLATIPFLRDMGQRTGWFTARELADMIAVSESTPGPMGVNMATYVGVSSGGIPGGVIATLGLVTPSIIVILIIAAFLKRFRESKYVDAVFYGLRPASCALIAAAGWAVVTLSLLDPAGWRADGRLLTLLNLPCILLALAVLVLMIAAKLILRQFFPTVMDPKAPFFRWNALEPLDLLYIPTVVLQELLVRGVMQGSLERILPDSYPPAVANIIASLVFGAVHIHKGIVYMVGAALLLSFFGILYSKQKTIWGLCIPHLVLSWSLRILW